MINERLENLILSYDFVDNLEYCSKGTITCYFKHFIKGLSEIKVDYNKEREKPEALNKILNKLKSL